MLSLDMARKPLQLAWLYLIDVYLAPYMCIVKCSRAKEQTEAREQYFVELKEQLDEVRSAYETDLAQVSVSFGACMVL
jgi:hypothetical protein